MAKKAIDSPTSNIEIRDAREAMRTSLKIARSETDAALIYAMLVKHAWSLPEKLCTALGKYDAAMKKPMRAAGPFSGGKLMPSDEKFNAALVTTRARLAAALVSTVSLVANELGIDR